MAIKMTILDKRTLMSRIARHGGTGVRPPIKLAVVNSGEPDAAFGLCHRKTEAAALQVVWLQGITVGWMLLECSIALIAALHSRSVALLAFGSDSFVELLSAVVVLLQFSPAVRLSRERAAQFSGILLFVLAVIVAVSSVAVIARRSIAEVSWLGIGVTAGALLIMPVLTGLKRNKARELNNRALAADAAQSATCAYLAALTLLSLALNALFHLSWIDSIAALLAVPFLIAEGRRALRGESCGCCSV